MSKIPYPIYKTIETCKCKTDRGLVSILGESIVVLQGFELSVMTDASPFTYTSQKGTFNVRIKNTNVIAVE